MMKPIRSRRCRFLALKHLSLDRLFQKENPIAQGSGRNTMSAIESFNHEVTTELAGLIPEEDTELII